MHATTIAMPFHIRALVYLILAASCLETASESKMRREQSPLERDSQAESPFITNLETEWAKTVDEVESPYPRPALVREGWLNLNGLWDYAIRPNNQSTASEASWENDKIRVPFPLESKLSNIQKLLAPGMSLWYKRSFELPASNGWLWKLNFEAVDYYCEVFVNGHSVGTHTGGNLPFSFDISSSAVTGHNTLVVRVRDETGTFQLRGKQSLTPGSIWYTRVSGIWQPVWLEAVPTPHVKQVRFTTKDFAAGTVHASVDLDGIGSNNAAYRVDIKVTAANTDTMSHSIPNLQENGANADLTIPNPRLWSPDSPFLYDVTVEVVDREDQRIVDSVKSYFGIRQVGSSKSEGGHLRFTLNGKEIFHYGVLDQGWWPEGLLSAPTDDALMHDITFVKAAGFNMIRKHIKVENRRFYYHCDVVGLLVWQDQVSSNSVEAGFSSETIWTKLQDPPTEFTWSEENHAQYMLELGGMIDLLEFHPCIVVWTVFNECWGQHRTLDVGQWITRRDPTRLINIASGGNFYPIGNIVDAHTYPEPNFPFDASRFDHDFIKVIGEFGGHGWYIKEYGFHPNTGPSWGYDALATTQEEFENRYVNSLCNLAKQREIGVAGGVYTQLTDVEIEVNGLMTYDRKYYKIPMTALAMMHEAFFKGAQSVCRPWPFHATTSLGPDVLPPHGERNAGGR